MSFDESKWNCKNLVFVVVFDRLKGYDDKMSNLNHAPMRAETKPLINDTSINNNTTDDLTNYD